MSEQEAGTVTHGEFGVAFWNILYDAENFFKAPSQFERMPSIAKTLEELPIAPDLYGLLEVELDQEYGNLGERIANQVSGNQGVWAAHDAEADTRDERIGLFGPANIEIERHTIVGDRALLVTALHGIQVALTHLTFNPYGERLRYAQVRDALDILGDTKPSVLMGDLNSASWQRSRRLIKKTGFVSVFEALGQKRPATVLTEPYRQNLSLFYRTATKRGFAPDDIYVRGVTVLDAGIFEGDSDHRGVWARLLNSTQTT